MVERWMVSHAVISHVINVPTDETNRISGHCFVTYIILIMFTAFRRALTGNTSRHHSRLFFHSFVNAQWKRLAASRCSKIFYTDCFIILYQGLYLSVSSLIFQCNAMLSVIECSVTSRCHRIIQYEIKCHLPVFFFVVLRLNVNRMEFISSHERGELSHRKAPFITGSFGMTFLTVICKQKVPFPCGCRKSIFIRSCVNSLQAVQHDTIH